MSETTTRVMQSPEVEELFARFVEGAQELDQGSTEQSQDDDRWSGFHEAFTPPIASPGEDVHLLTKRKSAPSPLPAEPAHDDLFSDREMKGEAGEAAVARPAADGVSPTDALETRTERDHIPVRELERAMSDMARLVEVGHVDDVRRQIAGLVEQYPLDLLLLRRISELFLDMKQPRDAVDCLLRIVAVLFERRNFSGMHKVLEQILELDPDDVKASKLLALVEARVGADG